MPPVTLLRAHAAVYGTGTPLARTYNNEGMEATSATVAILLRPHQWLKNGVVVAPLVFAHRLLAPRDLGLTLAYMIYSVSPDVAGPLGTGYFHLTVPFVVFGLFRYLYLVHRRNGGEDPTRLLIGEARCSRRRCCGLWAMAVVLLLYGTGLHVALT